MMNFLRKTLALSLVALSLAGVAFAADSSKLPEPASPVKSTLVEERVNVYIGSQRVNGYAIGDSIPITLVFEMTPPTAAELAPAPAEEAKPGEPVKAPKPKLLPMPRVDVAGLKMQVQSAEALDVEMLGAADEVVRYTRDGKEYLKVTFYVWQFVTTKQTQVDVKADFMYAVNVLEDGQPDWRKASTPTIHVGIRRTATDNQTNLKEGDIGLKASPSVPAAPYFIAAGVLLMLPIFGALAFTGYRRYMQPKKLNANETAWLELDAIFEDASKAGGLNLDQYKRIFFILRRRFGVLALDGEELFAALKSHKDLSKAEFSVIKAVFGMESLFFAKDSNVTPEQQAAFTEGVKALLPRH